MTSTPTTDVPSPKVPPSKATPRTCCGAIVATKHSTSKATDGTSHNDDLQPTKHHSADLDEGTVRHRHELTQTRDDGAPLARLTRPPRANRSYDSSSGDQRRPTALGEGVAAS